MSGVLSEQAARNAGAESTQRKTSGGTGAPQSVPVTSVHRVEADGVRIFYRSAGDAAAAVVVSRVSCSDAMPYLSELELATGTVAKSG